VANDYVRYRAGTLPLQLETSDTNALERFFSREGVRFRTRVFDLGVMRFRLVGGRVHQLGGRPSVLFVYRDERNRTLICQMYPGRVQELPGGAERLEHEGMVFSRYSRNGLTEVFWQEENVTCVLVSDAQPEETLSLAFFAKAVKI
jgi:hypothetical protein